MAASAAYLNQQLPVLVPAFSLSLFLFLSHTRNICLFHHHNYQSLHTVGIPNLLCRYTNHRTTASLKLKKKPFHSIGFFDYCLARVYFFAAFSSRQRTTYSSRYRVCSCIRPTSTLSNTICRLSCIIFATCENRVVYTKGPAVETCWLPLL